MDLLGYRAHRALKVAVASLGPLVETTDDEIRWHEPYQLGFLGTLITRIVERSYPGISTNALAKAQAAAWSRITGLEPDAFGSDVALLSTVQHPFFVLGCRNAELFYRDLGATTAEFHLAVPSAPGERFDETPYEREARLSAIRSLWRNYVGTAASS